MATSPLQPRQFHDRLVLHQLDSHDLRRGFHEDVAEGLSATPKRLAPKYFYDRAGSQLFEKITATDEYYPTRTEAWILSTYAEEIVHTGGGEQALIEFGSGSSTKTRLLLDVLARQQAEVSYIPIDISPTIVQEFGPQLLDTYPNLDVEGLITDYHHALQELPKHARPAHLFLFLGSSIGNFEPAEAAAFLADVGATLRPQDHLLLGTDLIKAPAILERAYNDAEGVTAAFNLNLLTRINRELQGEFDLATFRHKAFYNKAKSRIEMHLESLADQEVRIGALGRSFAFRQGETIHTENSHKFDYATLDRLFADAGMALTKRWVDPNEWFALNLVGQA